MVAKQIPGMGYALEAIVGQGLKLTSGGIGVKTCKAAVLLQVRLPVHTRKFTLSYVTGHSVGIGAYLNRIGQCTIQDLTKN